jgi:hypothetical protein
MTLVRIRKATPLEGRRLRLHLTDGRIVERDVAPLITGPVFEEVRASDDVFRGVRIEGGTVVWPNGADLCPDVLIWEGPPPDDRAPAPTIVGASREPFTVQNLEDRLTRARSWLSAAAAAPESEKQEIFIALFIALNAIYGRRQYEGDRSQTAGDLESFCEKLDIMHEADLDQGRATLTNALFVARPAIHAIATNVFLRDVYWRREMRHDVLVKRFEAHYSSADRRLLVEGLWRPLLRLVLDRVIVLRNQIFHGCVTHGPESRGWESVEQGVAVLKVLVPAFVDLMDRYGSLVKWEALPYPRLGSSLHPRRSRLA